MKRLRKAFMVFAISIPLTLVPTNCAKATIAGDVALLAQQIAQFLNDWDFDLAKWKDYADKFKQLEKIANTIAEGSQAYSTIKSMGKTIKMIERCGRDAKNYITYLEKFGSNFRIDRAYSIYTGFNRRTSTLYTDITKTIENITSYATKFGDQSTSVSPVEMLKACDEALDEFAGVIVQSSDETKSQLGQLCLQTSIDESCESNAEFLELGWY